MYVLINYEIVSYKKETKFLAILNMFNAVILWKLNINHFQYFKDFITFKKFFNVIFNSDGDNLIVLNFTLK